MVYKILVLTRKFAVHACNKYLAKIFQCMVKYDMFSK